MLTIFRVAPNLFKARLSAKPLKDIKMIFVFMQIDSFSQERFCTKNRFETDGFWNSEMVDCNCSYFMGQ